MREQIVEAVRNGWDNRRQVAVFLGVPVDDVEFWVGQAVADGWLEWVDGCCRSLAHFDSCELRVPLVRVSGGGR